AGSWVRRNNALAQLISMERDPLRGRLIGSSGVETHVYSDTPAAEVTVGSGCGAPVPHLVGEGVPITASPGYRLDAFVTANAPVLFAMDFNGAAIALGGGCTQFLAAPVTVRLAVADARGFSALPAPLLDNAALRGLTVHAQIATLQPGG